MSWWKGYQGIYYYAIYIISYSYLWLSLYFKKRRLDLYDVFARKDPEKLGLFVPSEEWAMEVPQKESFLLENADDCCFFGINSSSEFLFIHISRKPNSEVHCSLILRLANGKEYVLPEEYVIQKETKELHTFGSARLKMECLLPMRRWRIFFNGLLWEKPEKDEHSLEVKHVKFAFLWFASSAVHDYRTDFSVPLLAHTASQQKTEMKNLISFMKKVVEICDGYAQSGMICGTVEVQDESAKEVYLWGNRSRIMGKNFDFEDGRFSELYLNAQNGIFVYLKMVNAPRTLTDYRYGCVMQANGHIYPIDECHLKNKENSQEMICHSGGLIYKIDIVVKSTGHNFQNHCHGETYTEAVTAQINGVMGRGIKSVGTIGKRPNVPLVSKMPLGAGKAILTVAIHDPLCQDFSLTGGKGSSLAKLYAMSTEIANRPFQTDKFQVPRGVVVTTAAYELFVAGSLKDSLTSFEKTVWSNTSGSYSDLCERTMKNVINTALPESIVESLDHALRKVFGNDLSVIRFAVRSSATGEDTEQLSAAGQMESFLGVGGIREVLKALKECWASQFGFVAVQYKRRYGQLLNTPMAVVIQEMVPCNVAGVLFTCDPVSGNPSYITISANYGLGETVVSASAEPDTIRLQRTLKNELKIHLKEVGHKKSKVVMTGSDGVQSIDLRPDETSVCCLSDDVCLKLAKVAVKVEMEYGSPRDIEWGILNDQLFLLQARPITSISTETDFEIKHANDSFLRCEDEYVTKGNIGEVLCGSSSHLGIELGIKLSFIVYQRYRHILETVTESAYLSPYYSTRLIIVCGHVFKTLCDGFFKFGHDASDNYARNVCLSIVGRVLEDEKLFQMAKEHRSSSNNKVSHRTRIILSLMNYIAGYRSQVIKKRLSKYKIPITKNSAEDIFCTFVRHIQHSDIAMASHMECSISSLTWNVKTLALLATQEGGYNSSVFNDFAYLLSSCTEVESADVPSSIQRLGHEISKRIKPADFKKMSTEEALQWLLDTTSDAGVQFREFLSKHGHRGIREFDVYSNTWGLDAKPLVELLQGSISETSDAPAKMGIARSTSMDTSKLNVKLGFTSRWWLKYLIWNCRRCVREREFSKSVFIKEFHKWRGVCRCLAEAMVKEGRLPNEELLYFLSLEEIRQLLKSRSQKLVSIAFRRWKCHSELDKLIFPETCFGIPKPYNMTEEVPVSEGDLVLTGVPVSQGVVTARACVILSVEEASAIEAGDVLITYATDIGWSPYFPLLSGVATHLGGLISHGAVVARECGLPCIVGLNGAIKKFKTGDLVQLDGNKGILRRLKTRDEV